ncbi:tRNA (N(6)-L-threonylcarbamoyladenosine(37)-C(2))-methylthiotransferase MtaB [Pseudobutyrivibrio xylanivorans]|uniref:Threonylcarbamoyladenosine tRNA methylthiotransferase MtaB n=1 Tax=Pseudobutyrivibrio xylanivorans DSM 14809 TaxID=1123012 RepID=A0A1M6BI55_PSEXY|nr:tRNA (N(6)-L-threonylcarbamoyladenosine(37)-C(2))-methylthiotransferase MtaB [Pseudobutyrivibrio xylanivorans]SHI48395.1 threonylcarbamoyladenosine tRNA methylthiotransferase MtaB [Pseudobutyrivibrio xylanivorans DSM 14809]
MKKAALHNLGCKVNAYETEAMEELLKKDGFTIVEFDEIADVYVINTCSVTNIADRKSRQMIHKCKKLNPTACVVAAGCYVQNFGNEVADELGADIILGNNKKNELVDRIHDYFGNLDSNDGPIMDWIDINDGNVSYENMHIEKDSEHTRAFVKVQDGCNQFCSYCIIPFARGRIRSRDIDDVVEEVTGLAANGYKEVVITGIHLSSYGNGTDYNLADLLEAIQKIDGVERIRLGSLEPQIVTEDFAKRVSALSKMCPHFHLSLQSGCDTVLVRMNRKYTIEEYTRGVEILRKYFENPAITTDIIVGFPGETEEEFDITANYVKEIAFYELHVFAYSKRKGTKAATMPGQLTNAVKKERSAKLISIGNETTEAYRTSFIGKDLDILFEEKAVIDGKEYFIGFSREYIKCAILAEDSKDYTNQILVAKGTVLSKDKQYLIVEI